MIYIFIIPVIKNENIVIPNVKGISESEAIEKLQNYKLDVLVCYIEGTKDEVLYTFPSEESKVKSGSNITLYVSKKKVIYYEEFIGLLLTNNIDMINKYCESIGITFEVIYKVDNDSIPGVILEQNKKSYDKVNIGDKLIFTVAKSDLYFTMPKLIGMNIYEALEILRDYNIKTNIIFYYTPIENDLVIFQSVGEGNIIKKNNSYPIDIYVSKGLDLDVVIDYNNFVNVLSILDISYDIIYIESNVDNDTYLGSMSLSIDDNIFYYIYISK